MSLIKKTRREIKIETRKDTEKTTLLSDIGNIRYSYSNKSQEEIDGFENLPVEPEEETVNFRSNGEKQLIAGLVSCFISGPATVILTNYLISHITGRKFEDYTKLEEMALYTTFIPVVAITSAITFFGVGRYLKNKQKHQVEVEENLFDDEEARNALR